MTSRVRTTAFLAVLLFAAVVPAGAGIVEEIVATVNGELITMTEVEMREMELEQQLYGNLAGAELDAAMAEARKTMLVDMINEKLLYQRAERLGLDLEQVYRSAVENIKNQNNIQSDEELYKLLQQQGMSIEDFRANLLKYNVPDIMINLEVRQKIAITDTEAAEFYEENAEAFAHPTTYTFREVAFLLSTHSRQEAQDLALRVIDEAESGTDFMQLVSDYSEAPSKETAGLIENLPAPDMSPQILEALVEVEPGELTGIVETTRALFVLKLEERVDAHRDSLEEARPQIESMLKRTKFAAEMSRYMDELWEDNIVDVKSKYKKKYPSEMY